MSLLNGLEKKLLLTKELVIIEHILSAYFELSAIETLASNPALFKRNKSLKNTEHTSPVAIPLIKSYMFQCSLPGYGYIMN